MSAKSVVSFLVAMSVCCGFCSQVIDELRGYDTTTTSKGGFPGIVPFEGGFGGAAIARRKRMIWFPYPVYYGGSDANQIFKVRRN